MTNIINTQTGRKNIFGKASAYNVGDLGSILGSGRSPGEGNGNATHPSILAWKISWMVETGRLQTPPWGRKESDMTEQLHLT